MKFTPSTLASLRALLSPIDAADKGVEALAAPIAAARSAAARLRDQLAAIDQKIEATAIPPIAPISADPNRLEALIAGADVPKIGQRDIEAHAAKTTELASKARLLAVERQQIAVDLAAVQGRINQLESEVGHLGLQRIPAERAFIVALGEALSDAYRRDIVEFIDTHIPELLSVARKVAEMTGKLPYYHNNIWAGLSVTWPDESYVSPIIGGMGKLHHVWPRGGGTLFSGEPQSSPEIVAQLTAAVRASADSAKREKAEAAG